MVIMINKGRISKNRKISLWKMIKLIKKVWLKKIKGVQRKVKMRAKREMMMFRSIDQSLLRKKRSKKVINNRKVETTWIKNKKMK